MRLDSVEERKAFRDYVESNRVFEGRSADELEFFAIHGYFPKAGGGKLPQRCEYLVAGIRTVVTTEWVASDGGCEGPTAVRLHAVNSQCPEEIPGSVFAKYLDRS
jgi:hypothetical protein